MSQIFDEGCEGSCSGAEHPVAVQRAEDPLQTGGYEQTHVEELTLMELKLHLHFKKFKGSFREMLIIFLIVCL